MKHLESHPSHTSIATLVENSVLSTPVLDIHTHLYDPAFKGLLLWGIDDLLVYHYLVAESFRYLTLPFEKFWSLSKVEQADLIWNELFIERSPVSEACRGVLTTLNTLGLDVRKRDLSTVRRWFAEWRVEDYVTRCMELAGVRNICMTNSPFDNDERPVWETGFTRDSRFTAALRIDPLLLDWPATAAKLKAWGYNAEPSLSPDTFSAVRQFLEAWSKRIQAKYLMVSLPPDFVYPGTSPGALLIERAVLPHCREFNLPFAVMPGVHRQINPLLRLAGDGVGLTDLTFLTNLCAGHPDNKFLATVLARENQHELCVMARKFRNLHIFGCWWFTNVPELIDEMTRMRVELLGLSFTAQHSDARVLDQLIYKWRHSRQVIARVLAEKYTDLAATGWDPTPEEVQHGVESILGGDFERFCSR